MTRLRSLVLAATLMTMATPLPAFAHAGDHGELSLLAALDHLLSSPFHLGLMIAAVLAGVGLAFIAARGLRTRSQRIDRD